MMIGPVKRLLLRPHAAFLALIATGLTFRGEHVTGLAAGARQAGHAPGKRARRPGYAMKPGRREGGEEETR